MNQLEEKTVLVVDTGWYCEIAPRLAQEFGTVFYWSPWQRDFPYSQDGAVGSGLEGTQRVRDLYEALSMADLVVFPAEGFEGLQDRLKAEGVPVWGSGRGSALEENRIQLKQFLLAHGLPVVDWERVEGVRELGKRLYSTHYEGWFVKLASGRFRGDMETFHHLDWERSRGWYHQLAKALGPVGDRTVFLLEPPVEGFEGGGDAFSVDGQMPGTVMIGYEIKDSCYVSTTKPVAQLAAPIRDGFTALTDWFRQTRYRNLFSTEVRIAENGKAYLIDLAARFPWPPSGSIMCNVANLGEIMWHGAKYGELVEPQFHHRFAVELNLSSPWLGEEWLAVRFPESIRPWVKLHGVCRVGDTWWLRSQDAHREPGCVGTVVATGDDFKQTCQLCIKRAEMVEGIKVEFDEGDIAKAEKTVAEGEEHGISW